MSFQEPSINSPHRLYWTVILAGGRVWRDDPANGVSEWIDLARLNGDANAIQRFGEADLSVKLEGLRCLEYSLEHLMEIQRLYELLESNHVAGASGFMVLTKGAERVNWELSRNIQYKLFYGFLREFEDMAKQKGLSLEPEKGIQSRYDDPETEQAWAEWQTLMHSRDSACEHALLDYNFGDGLHFLHGDGPWTRSVDDSDQWVRTVFIVDAAHTSLDREATPLMFTVSFRSGTSEIEGVFAKDASGNLVGKARVEFSAGMVASSVGNSTPETGLLRINDYFMSEIDAKYSVGGDAGSVCTVFKGRVVACKDAGIVFAQGDGAIAEAAVSGATAFASTFGAIALATHVGADARTGSEGAVAKAMVNGAEAMALVHGSLALSHASGSVASAVAGATAGAWVDGAKAVALHPEARIFGRTAGAVLVHYGSQSQDWRYGHNKGAIYKIPNSGAGGFDWIGSTDPELAGLPEDQEGRDAHGARLAVCANACIGMADPQAEIAALRLQAASDAMFRQRLVAAVADLGADLSATQTILHDEHPLTGNLLGAPVSALRAEKLLKEIREFNGSQPMLDPFTSKPSTMEVVSGKKMLPDSGPTP